MIRRLAVCPSCRCHVRPNEARCPHCHADFATTGLRAPWRRHLQVRRLLFAAVAATGLGLAGCNEDVVGSCGADGGEVLICSQQGNLQPNCSCGSGGKCDSHGHCVSCGCRSDQWCDEAGACHDNHTSSGSCYGAPPVLV